jgi:hypothetical protein
LCIVKLIFLVFFVVKLLVGKFVLQETIELVLVFVFVK